MAQMKIATMSYQKGQMVSVKDCDGRSVQLQIWRDAGSVVFVASAEVFRLLEAGQKEVWPIGVPKSDVSIRRNPTSEVTSIMPAAKPVKIDKPIKFDDAMRKAMRVPPQKKNKPTKVWRKKRRKS